MLKIKMEHILKNKRLILYKIIIYQYSIVITINFLIGQLFTQDLKIISFWVNILESLLLVNSIVFAIVITKELENDGILKLSEKNKDRNFTLNIKLNKVKKQINYLQEKLNNINLKKDLISNKNEIKNSLEDLKDQKNKIEKEIKISKIPNKVFLLFIILALLYFILIIGLKEDLVNRKVITEGIIRLNEKRVIFNDYPQHYEINKIESEIFYLCHKQNIECRNKNRCSINIDNSSTKSICERYYCDLLINK